MSTGIIDRVCIHCGHRDTIESIGPIRPDGSALFSSSADFCTRCEAPWIGPSVDCEHCGTGEALGEVDYAWSLPK